jgi:hypothetical protein
MAIRIDDTARSVMGSFSAARDTTDDIQFISGGWAIWGY